SQGGQHSVVVTVTHPRLVSNVHEINEGAWGLSFSINEIIRVCAPNSNARGLIDFQFTLSVVRAQAEGRIGHLCDDTIHYVDPRIGRSRHLRGGIRESDSDEDERRQAQDTSHVSSCVIVAAFRPFQHARTRITVRFDSWTQYEPSTPSARHRRLGTL